MRRPALVAVCTVSIVVMGIVVPVAPTAMSAGAEDQAYRPLSKVPPVERFGQSALDAQALFLERMVGVSVRYADNGAVSEKKGAPAHFSTRVWPVSAPVSHPMSCLRSLLRRYWPQALKSCESSGSLSHRR